MDKGLDGWIMGLIDGWLEGGELSHERWWLNRCRVNECRSWGYCDLNVLFFFFFKKISFVWPQQLPSNPETKSQCLFSKRDGWPSHLHTETAVGFKRQGAASLYQQGQDLHLKDIGLGVVASHSHWGKTLTAWERKLAAAALWFCIL